jgi:MFS transporter, UMF1 family
MYWEEPKKKSWFNLRVIGWALFDFGTTVFSMLVISRYFGPWTIQQMGGTESYFNDAYAASMLAAAVLQVTLSPISDELGRRRFFVVWFTLLSIAACAAISYVSSLKLGLILFSVSNIGYRTAEVFYNAMLGDVTDNRHKARVSGIGVGIGYVGTIVGLIIAERFVKPGEHFYSPVFKVTAVIFLISALPLFLFVKEKPSLVQLNWGESLRNSVGSFITTIRRVFRNKEMLFFFIALLLILDSVHTIILNMGLYCERAAGLSSVKTSIFPLLTEINFFFSLSALFGIAGALLIGHIADKTSCYKAMLGVVSLWVVALILAMFSVQRKLFWVVGPLFGIGFGGIWTVSRAYLQELCHPEERGQMFALFGLVGRGAAIFGPFVWARVFQIFEPMYGERKSYRIAIATMLFFMVLGFWVLLLASPKAKPRLILSNKTGSG